MTCFYRYVNMARHCGKMKKDRRPRESESPLENLRIERTNLSQEQFAVQCGIPLRTYQRWISGKNEARPTPSQWKAMMRLLRIQSYEEMPDDFGPLGHLSQARQQTSQDRMPIAIPKDDMF